MRDLSVSLNIPAQRIVDLFVSACEGGSNYWCQSLTPKGKGDAYEAMLEGFTLKDGETGKTHEVSAKDVQKAMELFPTKCPNQFAEFLTENDDASTADCFLQLCVFQEVIYG